jgi:hypothetical protein
VQVVAALRSSRQVQALVLLGLLVLATLVADILRLSDAVSVCMDWRGEDAAASGCGRPTWSVLSPADLAWHVLSFDAVLVLATAAIALGAALRSTVAAIAGVLAFAIAPFFLAPLWFAALYPVVLAVALAATALLFRRLYPGAAR